MKYRTIVCRRGTLTGETALVAREEHFFTLKLHYDLLYGALTLQSQPLILAHLKNEVGDLERLAEDSSVWFQCPKVSIREEFEEVEFRQVALRELGGLASEVGSHRSRGWTHIYATAPWLLQRLMRRADEELL